MATRGRTINLNVPTNASPFTSFSLLLLCLEIHVSGHGDKCHPGAAVPPLNRTTFCEKAHLPSITLERSCWWPHKSHVNELWERPISHHARCALPLLFMAIIGPCFLRQWLHTDGSDDDSAQPNNKEAVRRKGGWEKMESLHVQWGWMRVWGKQDGHVYMMQNGF